MNHEVEIRFQISARSEDVLASFCSNHLKERGYSVIAPNQTWETLGAFMNRVGVRKHESLHRDIKLWLGRGGTLFLGQRPSGRLSEILSNADFDAFVVRNKRPVAKKNTAITK